VNITEAVSPDCSTSEEKEKEILYHRIRKNARRMWVYGDSTEDVAHDAWILALQRGYFTGKMLREAARNMRLWRISKESEISDNLADSDSENPEDIALLTETEKAVQVAIRKLSKYHQAIVYLRYWEGYGLEEIASAMGKSTSYIYNCLVDAEDILRIILADLRPKNNCRTVGDRDLPLFETLEKKPTVVAVGP